MFKWNLKRIYKNYFTIGEGKTTTSKIKIFSLSITMGILVSFAILAIFVGDPFTPVFKGIGSAFDTEQGTKKFMETMGILGLGGIAVAIGFKTGLFNMGVSGQMIMGGFTTGLIAISLGDSVPNGLGQILVIILSMMFAAMFAAIAGLLKAYFKVHEVVSTILLNWIAFYFMRWLLDPSTSPIITPGGTGLFSDTISDNFLLRFNGNSMWPIFIILISVAFIIWFLIYKTTFGMKLKMTGLNSDASKAAGVNTKLMTVSSMTISGAVAGLLGAVLYFGQQDSFAVPTAEAVPQTGFDGIAIALIAFSNPILIVPVATLFSLIQTGIAFTNGHIDVIFISLVLGVLMFVSAIGSMWNRFHFNKWIRILIKGQAYSDLYDKHAERKEIISKNSNDLYLHALNEEEKLKVIAEDLRLHEEEMALYKKQWEQISRSKNVYTIEKERIKTLIKTARVNKNEKQIAEFNNDLVVIKNTYNDEVKQVLKAEFDTSSPLMTKPVQHIETAVTDVKAASKSSSKKTTAKGGK